MFISESNLLELLKLIPYSHVAQTWLLLWTYNKTKTMVKKQALKNNNSPK